MCKVHSLWLHFPWLYVIQVLVKGRTLDTLDDEQLEPGALLDDDQVHHTYLLLLATLATLLHVLHVALAPQDTHCRAHPNQVSDDEKPYA